MCTSDFPLEAPQLLIVSDPENRRILNKTYKTQTTAFLGARTLPLESTSGFSVRLAACIGVPMVGVEKCDVLAIGYVEWQKEV